MKIIHVTFSLRNAGKENMLVDIANEQQSLGHEVAILVINNSLEDSIVNRINKNISLFRLNRQNKRKGLIPLFRLIFILNFKFRADIIHSHDPQLGLLLKLTSFTPLLLTIHGPAFNTAQMKFYNKLIAVSESVRSDIESRSNNKCEVIFNGVNVRSIKQRQGTYNQDNFKVILIGRLDHLIKGQDLVIEAAYILIVKKGFKFLKFFIIGDGDSREYLQDLVCRLKLEENVFLLGNRDREWIYENLHDYDLILQPSRLEGFGLTVTEAMAAKVPVISTDIEGPSEILAKGEFGLLFENNNYEDLAIKIERAILLCRNGEISRLTELAFDHCSNNFNIKRTAIEYCSVYSQIR